MFCQRLDTSLVQLRQPRLEDISLRVGYEGDMAKRWVDSLGNEVK